MDPDENCTCKHIYCRKTQQEIRIINPRCPVHGHRGHLQIVK